LCNFFRRKKYILKLTKYKLYIFSNSSKYVLFLASKYVCLGLLLIGFLPTGERFKKLLRVLWRTPSP
jgi:hypothetical protein